MVPAELGVKLPQGGPRGDGDRRMVIRPISRGHGAPSSPESCVEYLRRGRREHRPRRAPGVGRRACTSARPAARAGRRGRALLLRREADPSRLGASQAVRPRSVGGPHPTRP